jgi:hypothetical protein
MTITHAAVEWHDQFDNPPDLYVEVDDFWPTDWRYEQRGSAYFAQHESGFCSFFHYAGPSNEGYGGREFPITMIDGSKQVLKGPWSGNELGMAAAGFPMTYPVRVKHRVDWGDGWCSCAGSHLIESVWRETIERFCPDAHLERADCAAGSPDMSGEQNAVIYCCGRQRGPVVSTLLIARKGMTFAQSQAYKRAVRYARYTGEIRDEHGRWSNETPTEARLRLAVYTNGLIAQHSLEAWVQPFDLNNLPPLLPPRLPEPVRSYDPEDAEEWDRAQEP